MPKIHATERVMFVAGSLGTLPPQQLLLPVLLQAHPSTVRADPPPFLAPAGPAPGDSPSPTPSPGASFLSSFKGLH